MKKQDIKLTVRYIVLGFIMYLAYRVTSAEYIISLKDVNSTTLQVVVGAIFGALTMITGKHFSESIDKD